MDYGPDPRHIFRADWQGLSESYRIAYLLHISSDSGVPIGHSPKAFSNTTLEALFEANSDTNRTVHPISSVYAGDYSQRCASFYNDQMALSTQ